MITREVIFSPEARRQLLSLYDWIADQASPEVALAYVERLEKYVRGFDIGSQRGTRRDNIRDRLRTLGFERRVTIAFAVGEDRVTVLGIYYGGQNWQESLSDH